MYNDITTEERIDNYLLGRMSDGEKRLFENDLEKDAELKEEFECQKQVANAVQKVAMRDFLAKHAEERQKEKSNVIDLSEVFGRMANTVRDFFSSGQRVVWAFASSAAMIVSVIGGVNYASTLTLMRNVGMVAYADLSTPMARDGNLFDALINQAYSQIGKNEWDDAMSTIAEVRSLITDNLSTNATSEEEAYEQQILSQKNYDIDWYEAIILMKQGKIIKAKRLLEAIAASDSPYAETARKDLDNIF